MELNELLAFQKADLAYKKLKDELAQDKSYLAMKKSKDAFDNAKARVANAENAAENIVNAYNAAVTALDDAVKKINELCARAEKEELSDEEQAAIVETLEELKKRISEGEKKTAELKASADKAVEDYKNANKAGKDAREKYKQSKEYFEKLKDSKGGDFEKLKEEREALKSKVSPEQYELYKGKTAAGLYPAIVPAMTGDDNAIHCPGCGMGQSDAVKNSLEEKGYCECETCHRLIYKL